MSDDGRDPAPVRETERVTIIRDGGDRSGGSGVLIGVLVVLVALVLAFLFFCGSFNRAAHEAGVNVNVNTPSLKAPDINVKVPDVKVNVPKIDVKTEDRSEGNSAAAK